MQTELLHKRVRRGAGLIGLFIVCLLSGCQTSSEIVSIKKQCPVHGVCMFLGPPKVSTFPFRNDAEYKLAAKKLFPNVGKRVVIGCLPELWPKQFPRVEYCEKCRAAEIEWFRSKATENLRTPNSP